MTQIPQAAAEAFETAHDIMASIRAVKGIEYCYTVETALCCLKLKDVTLSLMDQLKKRGDLSEEAAEALFMGCGVLFAKMISLNRIAGGAEPEGTQQEAAEIMSWADRIYDMEARAVEEIQKDK